MNRTKVTLFAATLAALLLLHTQGSASAATTPAPLDFGAWLWSSPASTPPATAASLLAQAKSDGFNAIYVDVDDVLPVLDLPAGPARARRVAAYDAAVADFIGLAKADGLVVDVVSGEPGWALPAHRASPFRILTWVAAYDRSHADLPIRNVQFDVEPWSLPRWKTNKAAVLTDYVGLVEDLVTRNRSASGLSMVIPFYLGPDDPGTPNVTWRGVTASPFELVLTALDRRPGDAMLMMAYRNVAEGRNGVLGLSTAAMTLASQSPHRTRLIIAQETSNVRPAEITYYGTSKAYLAGQIGLIQQSFSGDSAFGGFAMEYLQSYLALP